MKKAFHKLKIYLKKNNIKNIKEVTYKNNDINIKKYLKAIDKKNLKKIEILYNKNNHNDIVYEIYNENKLNCDRLQYIIDNCTAYLNISSSLIKRLMKDNNIELLDIIFKEHFKFFDNNFIINLLIYYKNKTPISDSIFYNEINHDKYKFSSILNRKWGKYK